MKANYQSKRWVRFIVGLLILAATVCFFSSGYSPPGICGEVLRHNQAEDIDASPLFYTEVEQMPELEEGVRMMKQRAESVRDAR
jgi:hypothetical protein